MSRTRAKASLFACLVLATTALVVPGAQAAPESRQASARAKITMAKIDGAVTGGTWAVQGKVARAGKARNKKIIVEWKSGSSRYPTTSARTAVANKAGWARIGIQRKVRDGKYSIDFASDKPGMSKIRVRLVSKGRTIAVSRARSLTILEAPPLPTTVPPATPGRDGLKSGLTGQVNASNPLISEYMENVFNNVYWYWNSNYSYWGYGSPSVGHYWPAPGEVVYDGCTGQYTVDDRAAYYCPVNDYIVFSQQAAVDIWNGAYAQTPSAYPGDFALALAMAHEFGHNITFELWPNAHEVFSRWQLEAFADCLAGTWANSVYYQGILEGGDIEEGLALLISFGYSSPNYPTGNERAQFFAYGYDTGSPADCATAIL